MFIAGIYLKANRCEGAAVVVEKRLDRARKEFHIKDCRIWTAESALKDPVSELSDLYRDPRFVQKKKVFSQNKRPAKNTSTPPVLVASVEGRDDALIQTLRDRRLPVEKIVFHKGDGWSKQEQKILRYGCDYTLNPCDTGKLKKTLTSSGFHKDQGLDHATELAAEIDHLLNHDDAPSVFENTAYTLLPALMLALWYGQTIRQVKRY